MTYAGFTPSSPPPPADGPGPYRARWKRPVIRALCLLAAVLVLAVCADRFVAGRAEQRIADAFQEAEGTPSAPSVGIGGFPVLTQMAGGTLRRVDIKAQDIPAGGEDRPVPIKRLDVRLDGLSEGSSADQAHADSARATAFLSYGDLSDALGMKIGPAPDGGSRLAATIDLPLVGTSTVTAKLKAAGPDSIAFTSVEFASGSLPDVAKQLLRGALEQPVTLRNLPEGLELREAGAGSDGITASLSGQDVTFRPASSSSGV